MFQKTRLAVMCENNLPTVSRWVPAQRFLAPFFRQSREVCSPPPELSSRIKIVGLSYAKSANQAGNLLYSSGSSSSNISSK